MFYWGCQFFTVNSVTSRPIPGKGVSKTPKRKPSDPAEIDKFVKQENFNKPYTKLSRVELLGFVFGQLYKKYVSG